MYNKVRYLGPWHTDVTFYQKKKKIKQAPRGDVAYSSAVYCQLTNSLSQELWMQTVFKIGTEYIATDGFTIVH